MKKTGVTKRLAGALLALVMVLGMLPGTVWAAEAATGGDYTYVDYIEVISPTSVELVENADGHLVGLWNEETEQYDPYFYYELHDTEIRVAIHYKDGTVKQAALYDDIDGYQIYDNSWDTQYSDPWEVGQSYTVTISYMGKEATVPVTIVENPVDYIEVVSPTSVELVENADGYWRDRWNEETGRYEPCFYYVLDGNEIRVTIYYKDGTVKQAALYDVIDGYWIYDHSWDTQDSDPWEVGQSYTGTISYMGKEATVPVTIVENPIDYIEVINPASIELVENIDGSLVGLWNEETEQYESFFCYVPEIRVAIHYKDGTVKQAALGDKVDGYRIYDSSWDMQYDDPWEVGQTYTVTISYMGKETTVPVTVVENPVDYIEVINPEIVETIENADGYWDSWWSNETERYEPYFVYLLENAGIQVAIHYKDGTVKLAELDEEVDGGPVYLVNSWYGQYETPWAKDKVNIAVISYMGKEATVPVTIVESPVDCIEVISPAFVELVENANGYWGERWNEETGQDEPYFYYVLDGNEIRVTIYYKDGTVKQAALGDKVNGYRIYDNSWNTQHSDPWEVGQTYTGTISYMGKETTIPVSVVALTFPISGVYGDSLTWSVSEDGELTVFCTDLEVMETSGYVAHQNIMDRVKTVVWVLDGITAVGDHTFGGDYTVNSVTFIGNAPSFSENAFADVTTTVYYPANNDTWTEDVRQNYGGNLTWEAYTAPGFQQVSATLGADVGLNFYTDEEAASVVFTWNGGESVAQVSGTAAESGFRYTCPLTAKEIDAQVTAEVKDAQGNTLDTVTYSVAEYLAQLTVANGYDQETENMAQATLTYGMAAKAHFAGGAAVAPAAVEPEEIVTYYDANSMVTAAPEVSYYGRSLLLKDLTILRLYFAADSAPVVRVDGKAAAVTPYSEAGYYTVDIPVMARALRDSFAVTVDGTDIAFSVGVNDYIAKAVQDNAADSSLAGLCRALYWYGAAAQAMPEA